MYHSIIFLAFAFAVFWIYH